MKSIPASRLLYKNSPLPMSTIYGYVYLISNLETGMQYVGQTQRPVQTRWSEHLSQKCPSAGWFLNRAMREYESAVWTFDILKCISLDVHDDLPESKGKAILKSILLEAEWIEIQSRDPHSLYNMSKYASVYCKDCGFQGGTDFGLSIHLWDKHGAKCWTECLKCETRFRNPETLNKTGFAHWCSECWLDFKLNYFQFSCKICKDSFLWKAGLVKHMERQHMSQFPALIPMFTEQYRLVCSEISKRQIEPKNVYCDIWLECGRQIAGKIVPQCIDKVFYF